MLARALVSLLTIALLTGSAVADQATKVRADAPSRRVALVVPQVLFLLDHDLTIPTPGLELELPLGSSGFSASASVAYLPMEYGAYQASVDLGVRRGLGLAPAYGFGRVGMWFAEPDEGDSDRIPFAAIGVGCKASWPRFELFLEAGLSAAGVTDHSDDTVELALGVAGRAGFGVKF